MEFSIELTKESCNEIVEYLKKRSEELYMQQILDKAELNNEIRQKHLEQFMVVEGLLFQFELCSLKFDNTEDGK